MGDSLSAYIKKRIGAAKAEAGSSVDASTETGLPKNKIIINPDIVIGEGSSRERHGVLFFGRANPPTAGHEKAYEKVLELARKHDAVPEMVLSRTFDGKKNPLTPEKKLKHARRAFPNAVVKVVDKSSPTILHHLSDMHDRGITHVHVVAGSDRFPDYEKLITKYNGVPAAHGHYNFKSVELHSSGNRDPDSEGEEGISGTKQRERAAAGNVKAFASGAPTAMKPEHVIDLYHDVREGMGLDDQEK